MNKSSSDTLPGFCSESTKQNEFKTHPIQVTLPPGYIPVFNPRCILTCDNKQSIKSNSFNHPHVKHDAISRARLLQEGRFRCDDRICIKLCFCRIRKVYFIYCSLLLGNTMSTFIFQPILWFLSIGDYVIQFCHYLKEGKSFQWVRKQGESCISHVIVKLWLFVEKAHDFRKHYK